MQKAIQEFTIGFYDSSGVFSIYAKQDDTERVVKFHLYDEGNEYTDLLNTGNLTALVREELPSGITIPDIEIPSANIDATNSSIVVPITSDMVQEAGVAICDLVFIETIFGSEPRILSTIRFKLIISASMIAPNGGKEKEWFDNWTELYIHLKALEHTMETEEDIRESNEETRISNENTRVSNENIRIESENTRLGNEAIRVENENSRISNETSRRNAETERIVAEQARNNAEQARDAAEQIRESRVQEQVDEAHSWANGNTSATAPDDKPSATNNSKYYSDLSHLWCDGKTDSDDMPSVTHNAKFYADSARAVSGLFNGTKAEWDALTLDEKGAYGTVILIDF